MHAQLPLDEFSGEDLPGQDQWEAEAERLADRIKGKARFDKMLPSAALRATIEARMPPLDRQSRLCPTAIARRERLIALVIVDWIDDAIGRLPINTNDNFLGQGVRASIDELREEYAEAYADGKIAEPRRRPRANW